MTLKNRFISQSPFQEIYMVFQRSFHLEQVGIIMMNLQSIPGNSDNCSITHNHFFLKICVNLNTSHSTRAHFTLYYTLYTLYTKLKISVL